MILKINASDELVSWNHNDIFSIRIIALIESYGFNYSFCTFYKQIIDNKIVAIISCLDDDYTISIDNDYDLDEIEEFFYFKSYNSILTSLHFKNNKSFEQGTVMFGIYNDFKLNLNENLKFITDCFDYKKIFDFSDYNHQDFNSFYVDINHRLRHGTTKILEIDIEDKIVGLAILSSICNGYGILSSVKVDMCYRNKGFGSVLVNYMCSFCSNGIYLMREDNNVEYFYKNLDFKNIGEWRLYI